MLRYSTGEERTAFNRAVQAKLKSNVAVHCSTLRYNTVKQLGPGRKEERPQTVERVCIHEGPTTREEADSTTEGGLSLTALRQS